MSHDPANVGYDSFVDIVTNLIGILIILVLIIGMRIKNVPVQFSPSASFVAETQSLRDERATEASLQGEMNNTLGQIHAVERDLLARSMERDTLATMASAANRKIAERREQLDATSRQDYDLRRQLAEDQATLDRLQQERMHLENALGETVVVESYPTPIGKSVIGEEAHFQLRGNRIAAVPLEKLILAARDDARSKADKVIHRGALPEFTETIGPQSGFRFRYTAERIDEVEETRQGTVRRVGLRFIKWTLIPVDSQLGEPLEEALAEGSRFRQTLKGLRKDTTVTIWVYDDSFDAFRALRKELYRLEVPVAARPIPDGILIAGSPTGSRSEAQ